MARRLALTMVSVLACGCGSPMSPATTLYGIQIAGTLSIAPGFAPGRLSVVYWDGPPSPPPQVQLHAVAVYEDGHQEDVAALATWQSSNPSVATISSTGSVTFTGQGATDVTATYHGLTGFTSVTVMSNPCEDNPDLCGD